MKNHTGFQKMIKPGYLSFGLSIPIENYGKQSPRMDNQIEMAQLAEQKGFTSLWLQDVVLEDPTFEDPATGQIFDSFIYLTYLASHTNSINLGTAAIVFSLRHPLRTAKEVASIERLFPERLMLGVSSGDRRKDFSGLDIPIMERGQWFRNAFHYFQEVLYGEFPTIDSLFGKIDKANLVPKPTKEIPLFLTGYAQQTLDWIAQNGHGWMFYPQRPEQQQETVAKYRELVESYSPGAFRAFLMPLPLDLMEDPNHPYEKIPAGYRTGRNNLLDILAEYQDAGVNHIFFNLAQSKRPAKEVVEELGEYVLPHFQWE
ncbi:luciferase-type oxidoreductase, BA3436 family [Thalassobacillus cyri]|uniref:Luciferase-type oxidoreductase, BA3436 family n=1 Tax=Thalassobacillus cyri TaxID=571932 RepID=A0A1H3YY47_9BACI|nr:LLM class oxidoreductase [Thalassobacillus cyri]SEA16425.1 luciferase-type oxidoreductase, BA3436 family [Thalassobacillus cyri]